MNYDEKIEKMYREEQEHVARHTALKLAVEIIKRFPNRAGSATQR